MSETMTEATAPEQATASNPSPVEVPALQAKNLCFSYPAELSGGQPKPVLRDANWSVPQGAFALLVGKTGSGKTTLMRLAKPELAPAGERRGELRVFGRDICELDARESSEFVGFVFQSPENQIVCESVWHELAFGLENLGVPEPEMRLRIAETCQFLGMEPLFRRHTHELSGGQRQLVALASVLVMRPRLLLLDEPTSQLDPVAEKEFLSLVFRINRELGVTVVVATHRPEPMMAYATCCYRLSDGMVELCEDFPSESSSLYEDRQQRDPSGEPARMSASAWQAKQASGTKGPEPGSALALLLDDVWFRYSRDDDWVLRGCDFSVKRGEVRALMGGNGSGKSTVLLLAAGVLRARRGGLKRPSANSQALLPQSPRAILACETVYQELIEWADAAGYGSSEVDEALGWLGLADARDRHPYDLSQGQQQLLALEKLLLTNPSLLLLDEPTKGLDPDARAFAMRRIQNAARAGTTVVVATHDVGFVRDCCQTVSLLFDGQTALTDEVSSFLARSWIYGDAR